MMSKRQNDDYPSRDEKVFRSGLITYLLIVSIILILYLLDAALI